MTILLKPLTAEWVEKAEADFAVMEREGRVRRPRGFLVTCQGVEALLRDHGERDSGDEQEPANDRTTSSRFCCKTLFAVSSCFGF